MKTNRKTSWPWAIALVYALFAAAMIGFVTYTIHHPTDLVSKDYYREEIDYQRHIDSAKRATADSAALQFDASTHVFEIRFPGGGVTGDVSLYRPSDAALDRNVPIGLDSNHVQRIDLTGLAPGLWRVRLKWTAAGDDYFKEETLMVN